MSRGAEERAEDREGSVGGAEAEEEGVPVSRDAEERAEASREGSVGGAEAEEEGVPVSRDAEEGAEARAEAGAEEASDAHGHAATPSMLEPLAHRTTIMSHDGAEGSSTTGRQARGGGPSDSSRGCSGPEPVPTARQRICSMCSRHPDPAASAGAGVCGWCSCGRPVHYCAPECQGGHWGEQE